MARPTAASQSKRARNLDRHRRSSWADSQWPWIAFAVAAAMVSCLAAKLGLALMAQPERIALFWPSSGIAVGAVLALDRRFTAPLIFGVAAGIFLANITGDRNLPAAVFFAGVNVLEFMLVARIAEAMGGRPFDLDTLWRVFSFLVAAFVGTAIASLVATLGILAFMNTPVSPVDSWTVWMRSDAIGIVGLAPLFIGLRSAREKQATPLVHAEGLLLLTLLAAVAFALMSVMPTPEHIWTNVSPLAAAFPLLLLIAARLPRIYASAAVAIVTLIVVATTGSGHGRFSDPALPVASQLFFAQIVIASVAVSSLALAALVNERRVAEEKQRFLISQLDHRVKNGLALVQSVVDRSQESARTIDDFVASLGGRIRSMARLQSKLSAGEWQGLCLAGLITDELSPYEGPGRHSVGGPQVQLKPAAAQTISMVVHELATNAAKYGALSDPRGEVSVSWTLDADASGGENLTIVWREFGGPPVVPPTREGFGTSTIRERLPYELGGSVDLAFEPRGIVCTIAVPASAAVVAGAPAAE